MRNTLLHAMAMVTVVLCSLEPALGQTDDDLRLRLDRAVQTATNGGYWGVVLVERDGRTLLSKGYGFADYADRPNTPDTLFEIASISKPITAIGVLRLVELGTLRVDTPVREIFPAQVPPEHAQVTVRMLLTHTSGIGGEGLAYATEASRDEAVAAYFNGDRVHVPGATFAYSNAGYAVLAAIIEKVSGEPFEAFMHREVFTRAGMHDTGFINEDQLDRSRAASRVVDGEFDGTAVQWHWSWGYRGMGGVVTTAEDLARLDDALRAGRVLRKETLVHMYEVPTASPYGLGWFLTSAWDGTRFASHGGSVAGFGCLVRRGIDRDELLVLLSNGACDLGRIEAAIDGVLRPKPTASVVLMPGERELNEFKAVVSGDARWRIEHADNGVTLIAVDAAKRFWPVMVKLPRSDARKLAKALEPRPPG